jgi:tetratricopeptide (TPR) repeat protein
VAADSRFEPGRLEAIRRQAEGRVGQAFDYFLRGWTFYLYFRRDANLEARRMYREAIRVDPQFARAHAELCYAQLHAWLFNWDPAVTLDEAKSHIDTALRLDPNDYSIHTIAGACHLYRREFDESAAAYDHALELGRTQAIPDDMGALRVDRAEMLMLSGRTAEAIAEIESVLDQKGHIPEKWYHWVLGWAYYDAGRYEDSLKALSHIGKPRNAIRKNLIANHVALGNLAKAQEQAVAFLQEEESQGIAYAAGDNHVLAGLLQVEDRLPFRNPDRLKRWKGHLATAFEGLRQP